jgi:hypothetical protein
MMRKMRNIAPEGWGRRRNLRRVEGADNSATIPDDGGSRENDACRTIRMIRIFARGLSPRLTARG